MTSLRHIIRRVIRESLITETACPECGNPNAYVGFTSVECPNRKCRFHLKSDTEETTFSPVVWALARLGSDAIDEVADGWVDWWGLANDLHPFISNDVSIDEVRAVTRQWGTDEAARAEACAAARKDLAEEHSERDDV